MDKKHKKVIAYKGLKRLLDIIFSLLLILLLAFPMILIAASVASTSRGGAIFRQRRLGQNEKGFVCFKFRSMYIDAPSNVPTGEFFDADKYITPVGRFLRRTSLDELPQLFNVLVGEMSLVGPRPLIAKERAIREMRQQAGVYKVKPGMTGFAQLCGRDAITDKEKTELDRAYVEEMSFFTDLTLLLMTPFHIFSGDGMRIPSRQRGVK